MSTSNLCKNFCQRLAYVFFFGMLTLGSVGVSAQTAERTSCIVQAESLQAARNAVIQAGGAIANDLKIIRAVNAYLTAEQRAALERMPGVKVRVNQPANATVAVNHADQPVPTTDYAPSIR